MSGAAGIAAAKNRRSKPDPNQKPIISCSTKSGSCPMPPGSKSMERSKTTELSKSTNVAIDSESLQITGPMPLMNVLKIHEQRLNKIDEKLKSHSLQQACPPQACPPQADIQIPECDSECYDRISTLEEKVHMLEEVIMNLQLTLTNVQSFTMETSIAMLKLQNQTPVLSSSTFLTGSLSPVAPASPSTKLSSL
jgi:hypothetical protein